MNQRSTGYSERKFLILSDFQEVNTEDWVAGDKLQNAEPCLTDDKFSRAFIKSKNTA